MQTASIFKNGNNRAIRQPLIWVLRGRAFEKETALFCDRLNAVLPRDYAAANTTAEIKVTLRPAKTPTGSKDTAIAGHTITTGVILVTNNMREFEQELKLVFEGWVQ